MGKEKLNKEQQIFVVTKLAVFDKPQKVLDELKEIYPDVDVTLQAIVRYEIAHSEFPKKWKDLFESTRKNFLEKVEEIPIANKAYRLKKMQDMHDRLEADKVKNNVEIRATLKQAAEDMGDAFTNRREHSGLNGDPIQHAVVRVPPKSSLEEWKQQSETQITANLQRSESEN